MKTNKSIFISFLLLIIVAAIYRIIPFRPFGFAPQFAMALFGGSLFANDKKWAFALPVLSMFISDLLYQGLYMAGLGTMAGFYEGQLTNYILFALLVVVGFWVSKTRIVDILVGSIAAPTVYFILSNFFVWVSGAGLMRPKTFEGLMLCYTDALPFYGTSVLATICFSAILFGAYHLAAFKVQSQALKA